MRVVIDTNVAVSALIRPVGWTARQLERPAFEFVAPKFLHDEIALRLDEFAEKAGCDRDEMESRLERLNRWVTFVEYADYAESLNDALVNRVKRVDPADVPFAATFVQSNASLLWTRDRRLREVAPLHFVTELPEEA